MAGSIRSHAEAKTVIENWRRHQDIARALSLLNYFTWRDFKQKHAPLPNRTVLLESLALRSRGRSPEKPDLNRSSQSSGSSAS